MFANYPDISKAIHREGYVFILVFAVVTFMLSSISIGFLAPGLMLTVWCAYFFRNPVRVVPLIDSVILSAADGVVQSITTTAAPAELEFGNEPMIRVSVFLNIMNVHVNRIPVNGKISKLHYYPGKFFNASLDKASIYNERYSSVVDIGNNEKVIIVQIAGLLTHRIVCELQESQDVKAGDQFGIIRFGSRVDLYLPVNSVIKASVGQTVVGGETIIGFLGNCDANKICITKDVAVK